LVSRHAGKVEHAVRVRVLVGCHDPGRVARCAVVVRRSASGLGEMLLEQIDDHDDVHRICTTLP
jgi:hypothetical protein